MPIHNIFSAQSEDLSWPFKPNASTKYHYQPYNTLQQSLDGELRLRPAARSHQTEKQVNRYCSSREDDASKYDRDKEEQKWQREVDARLWQNQRSQKQLIQRLTIKS